MSLGLDDSYSSERHRLLNLDRIVVGGIWISLLWKIYYFFVAYVVYRQLPMVDDFFPLWLRNANVFFAVYLAAMLCCALVFLTRDVRKLIWIKLALTTGLIVLCIHQQSYNDITFLTCTWSSIWSFWLTSRINHESPLELQEKGVLFAHLIISLIFLGGAVGKMTPGYWNGDVFFEIYFKGRDFYVYEFLRNQFDEVQLRNVSKWHSRSVIVVESLCSMLWLLPRRLASVLAIVTLFGIALTNNLLLFSVVSCLIGLACIGLFPTGRVGTVSSGKNA